MQVRALTNMGRPNWDIDGNDGDVHSYDATTGKFYAVVSAGIPLTSPRYVRLRAAVVSQFVSSSACGAAAFCSGHQQLDSKAPNMIASKRLVLLVRASEQVAQVDWTSAAMLSATQINFPTINGTADPFKTFIQMEFC